MNKVFLLGANKQIDRAEQVVEVNQIIQMEGYSCDKYVVYEVSFFHDLPNEGGEKVTKSRKGMKFIRFVQ